MYSTEYQHIIKNAKKHVNLASRTSLHGKSQPLARKIDSFPDNT